MLTRISVQNFRCLKTLDVSLRPLTVLIGANDSGKSTFLNAIKYLAREHGFTPNDRWRNDPNSEPELKGFDANGQLAITLRSNNWTGHRAFIAPTEYYRLPSNGPALIGPGYADSKEPTTLDESGTQVAALWDYILRRDRRRFDLIAKALCARVPGLEDVNVGVPTRETRRVELRIDGGLLLDPDSMSTGVRLMVFFLALAYHPNPPKIMLLEEPENGLHPARMKDVMDLLRSITRGEHCGHAAQVILTTHSPLLLNYVDLDTDQVLVFRREPDGSRTAEPVDKERLSIFLDQFMLGEVWINQDEAGLVAKKS